MRKQLHLGRGRMCHHSIRPQSAMHAEFHAWLRQTTRSSGQASSRAWQSMAAARWCGSPRAGPHDQRVPGPVFTRRRCSCHPLCLLRP